MTAALDICVSANSGLVHVEEKATGRNVATMTMKAATKEEKIDLALLFAAAPDLAIGDFDVTPAFERCEYMKRLAVPFRSSS